MSRRRVFLLALVAFLLIPAAALAGTLFSDVTDGSTHFKGIEFMKSSGVTLGCGDGTTYCPKDPVLREQMATFMYRLSGNDPATPPSVNADKVDGKDAAELETSAFSTHHDLGVDLSGSGTVLDLDLAAGSYVIFAKAWFRDPSGVDIPIHCRIQAGADYDESQTVVPYTPSASVSNDGAMSLMVVHTFASAGTAVLTCDDPSFNSTFTVYDSKITAIEVDNLSNAAG
ncbi:MAG: hypothetical protein P1T08_18565 [Acidimicrobiia bacterium]|nr:hypothetical protein [Acidimicrobiia bacterium]